MKYILILIIISTCSIAANEEELLRTKYAGGSEIGWRVSEGKLLFVRENSLEIKCLSESITLPFVANERVYSVGINKENSCVWGLFRGPKNGLILRRVITSQEDSQFEQLALNPRRKLIVTNVYSVSRSGRYGLVEHGARNKEQGEKGRESTFIFYSLGVYDFDEQKIVSTEPDTWSMYRAK